MFGTMLGVLDKEVTKTGMTPGFYGAYGLVGKADIEWKLLVHQCNEEKCLWEHLAAGNNKVW